MGVGDWRVVAAYRRARGEITPLAMKAAIPFVFFAVLWGFAAWVVGAQCFRVLAVTDLDADVHQPGAAVVSGLQTERRATVVYLSDPTAAHRQAMLKQRKRTDAAIAEFRRLADGGNARTFTTDAMDSRIAQAIRRLGDLRTDRSAVDTGRLNADQAAYRFNAAIDPILTVFDVTADVLNDATIGQDFHTLNRLGQSQELLSREDALLAGSIAAHRLSADERTRFVKLVGARDYQHSAAASALPQAGRVRDARLVRGPGFSRLAELESRVVGRPGRPDAPPPITAADWQQATGSAMSGLQGAIDLDRRAVFDNITPVTAGRVLQFIAVVALGGIALVALGSLTSATVRDLAGRLTRLREAARDLADVRLPRVVERIGRGEHVDIAAAAPPLDFGTDEIGLVGGAFNAAQRTAIAAAVEQAEQRRGIRDMLQTIARRTQTRLHRQLKVLDRLERRDDLGEQILGPVFEIDHLATQLRRYTENLLILSGANPARGWRNPVPLLDVTRGAVGEASDYQRVEVPPMDGVMLAGRAAIDLSHLLAELIENAVSFSDPRTTVHVRTQYTSHGYALEIEDHGLGMDDARLATANERIASPGEFNLEASDSNRDQLGLHVVGRLAERHGLRVELRRNIYAGITAVVFVPADLLIDPADDARPEPVAGPAPAVRPMFEPVIPASRPAAALPAPDTDARPAAEPAPSPVPPATAAPHADAAPARTANGLPVRNPQASFTPPEQPASGPAPDGAPAPPERSAERVRDFVGAAVLGTREARRVSAAARARYARNDEGGGAPPPAGGPPRA